MIQFWRKRIISRKLCILTAPTGAGKSSLISELDPERFEILSFDSRQVYQVLEVGTAKPSLSLRNKIPHHLVDFLPPDEEINAAKFTQKAFLALEEVYSKGKIPLITCGTGFYLKAFLNGMFEFASGSFELRKDLESLSREERWFQLEEKDPEACKKINYNDDYRVCRALEIVISSGKKWSEAKPDTSQSFFSRYPGTEIQGFFIHHERAVLYERINRRVKEMIEAGIIEETKNVIDRFGKNCPALKSLGYNFAVENIQGKIDIGIFYELFSRSHRNYAKKQITWFKKEVTLKPVSWNSALEEIKKIGERP